MQEVIILVDETPEGLELQAKIIQLIKDSEVQCIVLPGGVKRPKVVEV